MNVLQFSGGKDSLAVLYLSRPHLHEIEVHFGDAAALPEVREFVQRTCEKLGATLRIIRPSVDIEDQQSRFGLPTDVLPVWNSVAWTFGGAQLQSSVSCCSANLWGPLYRAAFETGAKLVLRGAKACDEQQGVANGFTDENGITYSSPIWDWTDGEVMAYLEREGAEIPSHYSEVNSSLDCWLCTGHTHSRHANSQFRYLKKHHPDLWARLETRLSTVKTAVRAETAAFDAAIDGVI